jgi:hypothetical protein
MPIRAIAASVLGGKSTELLLKGGSRGGRLEA